MFAFSPEWFSALLAVVFVDLLLAGDNAIVIALAARGLPASLQRKAILWGTAGAILVRAVMTVGVVWLLQWPGLMLLGGLALVWVALGLLAPPPQAHAADEATAVPTAHFWRALKTIVVADALMGIDNVLGVAGVAHGDMSLVIIGLLLSVPVVVWSSAWVLKLVTRFTFIPALGASLLAFTAAKMMLAEPWWADAWRSAAPWCAWGVPLATVLGVLGLATWRQRAQAQRCEEPTSTAALTQP